jgi:hypothetical protein
MAPSMLFPADFLEHALNETVTLKRVQSSIPEASLLLARGELAAHEQTFVQVAREFKWTDDYFTALSVAVAALHAYQQLAHSTSQQKSSASSAAKESAAFEALMAAWDDWSTLLDTLFLPNKTARADARMEQVLSLSQCEPDAVWHTFWQWAYWAAKGHALYQMQELPALLDALQPLMNNNNNNRPQSQETDAQHAACQNAFRRLMRWLSLPPLAAQTTRNPQLLLNYLHHVRTQLATSEPPL